MAAAIIRAPGSAAATGIASRSATMRPSERSALAGWVTVRVTAPASMVTMPGALVAGEGSGGSTTRGSGVRSSRAASVSAPDTPSMAQWWTLA